jgi:hypothetical protein
MSQFYQQGESEMEKEWTLTRRMDSLYSQYLDDVKSILIERSDVIDISSIDLRWRVNDIGYRSLVGSVKDKSGSIWDIKFVPEEPFTDANDIINEILGDSSGMTLGITPQG